MAKKTRVTLAEIAHAAGVSVPTVARILAGGNKETWPSAAKRAEKVRTIARELGYRPDHSARSLASRRSDCVALAFGAEEPLVAGLYAPVFQHAIAELAQRGYDLLPVRIIGSEDQWSRKLIDNRVAGILVMQPVPEALADLVEHYDIPSVLINIHHERLSAPQLLFDDAAGMDQAVGHLHEFGHRHLVYLNSVSDDPDQGHYHLAARRDAFMASCQRFGITGVVDSGTVGDLLERLDPQVKGVICRTDDQAVNLIHSCHQRGIGVGTDLSIIGFNDEAMAQQVYPRLTSVRVPIRQMAHRAIDLLLTAVESDTLPKAGVEYLPETLQARASTGPVPS
ncbi:MAG: LacI family DNA-binding transcriptional regulator [Planctomycetota bacterium]|nr:LacI family DNA-binding transcriptional regulator [Planctomycetota bacterium]